MKYVGSPTRAAQIAATSEFVGPCGPVSTGLVVRRTAGRLGVIMCGVETLLITPRLRG